MIGRTNTGGGGAAGAIKKGTIVVSYPVGSECTVTNGTKTYKALDTSGAAAFAVDAGTWTVTAVDGEESASKEVTVAEGDFAEVELSFATYIFKSGSGALIPLSYASESAATASADQNAISLSFTSSYGSQSAAMTTDAMDLTDYSVLGVVANCTAVGSNAPYSGILGVFGGTYTASNWISKNNSDTNIIAQTAFEVKNGVFELSLEGISGNYRVGTKGTVTCSISAMYLR